MGPVAARVLLLDAGDALARLRAALEREGIAVESIAWEAGELAAQGDRPAPAIAVLGPGVPNAPAVARRLAAGRSLLHVVFVAEEAQREELRRVLLFSPPANTSWKLVASDVGEVREAVVSALESARRSQQVRTTLDRVNLRLAAPAPPDAQDYRRLVVSDHYLASVLKHVQDAIVSLDLQGTVLSWNAGATRLFGLGAAEAVGKPLPALTDWSGDLRELLSAAVAEGWVRSDLRFRQGGREVLVDATFSAIEEHRSQVIAVAAILRDVTERKRTEEALAANEARFRALADNIPQLAWMTDEKGEIFWYNRRWYDYTGTTLETMRGWGWQKVHHPEHVERVVEKFRAHIAAGVEWEDTFPLRSRFGEFRWFLSRAFPIRDASGRVTNWFGTNTDITAERQAQEALREADRRKNEFISVLSHELRNPLSPIRSSVYLLEHAKGDEEIAARARAVIARQTDHLTRLVDDLLDVTRITQGKVELRRERTDLAEVLRATAEDYAGVVESAGLALAVSGTGEPVYAHADADRIRQVVGNLLQNAIKATPSGGRLEVALACEARLVRIDVRDTGVGIEAALLESLFQPFVQGPRTIDRAQGGLGLGLALARGIVELHGGRLEGHSDGPGHGATFTMWLPALDAKAAEAFGPRPHAGGETVIRKVLIVDDNRDAADSLAQLVRLFGHLPDVAYDAPAALALARDRRHDVVLCDLGLPGMNGYELARRLRAEFAKMRLVAVSGYAQEEDRRQSAEAGFEGHLAKPPRPDDIRRVLERCDAT
jgi:PAS domain S-box-containing protein